MATGAQWAWIAGIIEGEGTLVLHEGRRLHDSYRHKAGSRYTNISIRVSMTDFDVIDRLRRWTGVGNVHDKGTPGPWSKKPQRMWEVGKQADISTILDKCLPWFGERRTQKAKELLDWVDHRRTGDGHIC